MPTPAKKYAWGQILVLIVAQVFGEVIRSLWEKKSPYIGVLSNPNLIVMDIVYASCMVSLALILYKRTYSEHDLLADIRAWPSLKNLFAGLMAGFLLYGLATLFLVAVYSSMGGKTEIRGTFSLLLALPAILDAVYAGAIEEILFRGFLLAELRKATTPRIAIILQACIFATVHLDFSSLNTVMLLVFGLVCGYLTLKSGSLWPAIGGHVAWNFWGLTILGTPMSEILLPPLIYLSNAGNKTLTSAATISSAFEIVSLALAGVLLLVWSHKNKKGVGRVGS